MPQPPFAFSEMLPFTLDDAPCFLPSPPARYQSAMSVSFVQPNDAAASGLRRGMRSTTICSSVLASPAGSTARYMVRTGVHQVRAELRSQLTATGSSTSATAAESGVRTGSAFTMKSTVFSAS